MSVCSVGGGQELSRHQEYRCHDVCDVALHVHGLPLMAIGGAHKRHLRAIVASDGNSDSLSKNAKTDIKRPLLGIPPCDFAQARTNILTQQGKPTVLFTVQTDTFTVELVANSTTQLEASFVDNLAWSKRVLISR